MNSLIANKLNELKDLCKQYKVRSLYLFGSANTRNFKPESDLDFLISFNEDISIKEYTDNYFRFSTNYVFYLIEI